MSDDFSFDISPFNELTATEKTTLRDVAVLAQHRVGDSLLIPHAPQQHLWVLRSGARGPSSKSNNCGANQPCTAPW